MDEIYYENSFEEGLGGVSDGSNKDDSCVHVAVRVRPHSTPQGGKCLSMVSQEEVEPLVSANKFQTIQVGDCEKACYTFDHVFPTSTHQEYLYLTCVESLVHSCLEGYNATVFAYGQTGSGKTHTMIGDLEAQKTTGVIPRALEDIFAGLEEKVQSNTLDTSSLEPSDQPQVSKPPFEYQVKVQFLELYGEDIHDLVDENQPEMTETKYRRGQKSLTKNIRSLAIRDGKVGEDAEVLGACHAKIESSTDALTILRHGMARRRTEKTAMNSESSRSHAIFTLVIQQTQRNSSVIGTSPRKESVEMKTSKIHFVDLAGSERIKSAKTEGKRMKEGININKGLFALGNVISALGNEKSKKFVPYRDSKLTRLLKGSLGGNHKTLMIACVRDSDNDETINTLRYANRAKNIKNNARVNIDPSSKIINALTSQVGALAAELLRLRENIPDDDGCPFSSDVLNSFVSNALPNCKTSERKLYQSNSSLPFAARPASAPTNTTSSIITPKIGQSLTRSLKRSRSDGSLEHFIPIPRGSPGRMASTGEGNDEITKNLALGDAQDMGQIALLKCTHKSYIQTLEIEEQITLYDSVRASLRESLRVVKPLASGVDGVSLMDDLYEYPQTSLAATSIGTTASERDRSIGVLKHSSSLTCATAESKKDYVWISKNPTPPPYTCGTIGHEQEYDDKFSTDNSNENTEDMLEDVCMPLDENCSNAMTDYQEGYQGLKMKNRLAMINMKAKNCLEEKKYLERMMNKFKDNPAQALDLSKSICKIEKQIFTLKAERCKILESKTFANINKSFHAIKDDLFDINEKSATALGSEGDMSSSFDFAGSLGKNSQTSKNFGLDSKDPPIPSVLIIKNKSHCDDQSDRSLLTSASNRKIRTTILRYSTFIIKPFIPLLSKKRDDDYTLPYPLRL